MLMPNARRGALLALILIFASMAPAWAVNLTLAVRDGGGSPLPVRVHVVDGNGASYPSAPDSVALAFYGGSFMRSFFYTTGDAVMSLPPGNTTVTLAHGFEFRPRRFTLNLQADTTLSVTMTRAIDLTALGWFSGDNHVHTHHPPIDYSIDAEESHRIAMAEDLNMTWLLDNGVNFSGASDPHSTPNVTIYYSTEYRNQAYGHVALLGLKDSLGTGCCLPPDPAYPMLTDLRASWTPASDEAMSLCHPIDGAAFFDDNGWPAWGLGREIPVLAAKGALDMYDIASYGNLNDVQLDDWYRLLNCGFRIPAGGGTDCRLNSYFMRPAGGFRVYVSEPYAYNDPSSYVESLRAGRSFVTNFPLILDFSVQGLEAGSIADVTGPSVNVPVHFRVFSVLPVQQAKIIRDGQVVQTIPLSGGANGTDQTIDTTVSLLGSSWIAVRVEGTTAQQVAVSNSLFAHTSPVYFVMDAHPQESTVDAAHWLDWIDSLGVFVDMRGGWVTDAQRIHVTTTLEEARSVYRLHFHTAPAPFGLLSPGHGDTLLTGAPIKFDWQDSSDPEPGDRILYQVTISADSLFLGGQSQPPTLISEYTLQNPLLTPNRTYWWKVSATDRGGHRTMSTPAKRRFYWKQNVTGVEATLPETPPALWVWPNPSTVEVGLRPSVPLTPAWGIEILGVDGRRLARTGPAGEGGGDAIVKRAGDLFLWRARDAAGHRLPSGSYYVRLVPLDGKSPSPPATRVLLLR